MMYCVTVVIVALIICTAISLPTLLEFKTIKIKKLQESLADTERKCQILEVKYDRIITQQVKELTVLHDKLSRLMDKQNELAEKLDKTDK